jgi:hypothetical protein
MPPMAPGTRSEGGGTARSNVRARRAALTLSFRSHEGAYRCQCGANAPSRLPLLGVVLRDAQADFFADFETAILRAKQELRGLVGVLVGQDDAAVVSGGGRCISGNVRLSSKDKKSFERAARSHKNEKRQMRGRWQKHVMIGAWCETHKPPAKGLSSGPRMVKCQSNKSASSGWARKKSEGSSWMLRASCAMRLTAG